MSHEDRGVSSDFPSTRWSLLQRVNGGEAPARRIALSEMLGLYFPALRAHLMRAKRVPLSKADDLLQGFVCDKVLERDLLSHVQEGKGKFRTFLLCALDRYLVDQFRSEQALRRAPDRAAGEQGKGDAAMVASDLAGPSAAFDSAWARAVVAETVFRMKSECDRSGRADVWGLFDCRLLGPAWDEAPAPAYAGLIGTFGLTTEAQAANLLHTGKRMFRRHLRAILAEHVGTEREIDEELRDLISILRGRRA